MQNGVFSSKLHKVNTCFFTYVYTTWQHCKNLWYFCDTAHTFVAICWKLNKRWHNMRSCISPLLKYCYCVILSVIDLIHNQESYHQPNVLPSWQFWLGMLLVIWFQVNAICSPHNTHGSHALNDIHCDKIGRKLDYWSTDQYLNFLPTS